MKKLLIPQSFLKTKSWKFKWSDLLEKNWSKYTSIKLKKKSNTAFKVPWNLMKVLLPLLKDQDKEKVKQEFLIK